ncbi:MAG: tetratricopeptide repeat protein [Phycisphaeraceae bacterium]|nr:tetratricopeptide repeat protein [Phycisphaeraceae bacterium]
MATRINTKFVITLASIIVLLALSMVIAFMFLKKSAEDHFNLAEAAMVRAVAVQNKGEMDEDAIKLYNSELKRAAKHYGNARSKEATNVDYLYGYIDAHQKIICQNLTSAGNVIDAILAGAASIHDTPRASEQDRAFLYQLLHERLRINLQVSRASPLGNMLTLTAKRLDTSPDDAVAKKYRAMALSYMPGQRTDETEIEQDIADITAALKDNPKTPWLQTALARYHLGNARRIYSAKGNTETPETDAGFALAVSHITEALKLSAKSPFAYVEAAGILSELRSRDNEEMKAIRALQLDTARSLDQMLRDKGNRDSLYTEELGRAIAILIRVNVKAEEEDPGFDGLARAQTLAELLVKDRPDEPAAYQSLGNRQRELNKFDDAAKTIAAGLAIDRLGNARQFVRDQQARLSMQSQLADIKCTLALQSAEEDRREALLKEADKLVKQLAEADTSQTQWRDARVDFLRGRIALAKRQPTRAVTLLERANRAYNSKDVQTLRLLAQTHTQLGNNDLVVGFYETIVSTLRPGAEDLLNLINLYLAPGENQQLEKAEAQLDRYQQLIPGDIRAVRLRARLLAQQNKLDEAIALLQEQDLEKHPDLMNLIASYEALLGNTDGVIKIMRERLANRAEGEGMNIQLVTRLINMLPDASTKEAELDRLVEQGLDTKIADVFKRVLVSGKTTLEDELELIDVRTLDPAENALQKFLTYRRWNDTESARPYLDKAIDLGPDNPQVIEWNFRIALSEARYDDAEQAIDAMLELPLEKRTEIATAGGRFMRAQIQAVRAGAMEVGEARNRAFRQATVSYNNALDEYSHYIDGWVQLGRLHLAQNNFFAAQDSLREALSRQSRNVTAIGLMARAELGSDDQVNAMERYATLLTIQPNNANALNQYTAIAQQLGQPQRAISLREQIRKRVPNNFDNRRVLAALYAQNNDSERAEATIKEIIEAEGNTRQNVGTLAQIYARNEQHDKSIQVVNDYLAGLGDKAAWQDHALLAQSYEAAKQTAQADVAFAKAIEIEQAEGTFLASLSQAQARLNRGQAQEAAAQFERLAQQNPDNAALKQQAAALYLRLQQFDKAEAIANQMPASASRARLLVQLANAQQGQLGVAIKRAKQAAKDYPSDFGLRLNLVELLRAEQDRQPADKRNYSKVFPLAKALASDHPDRIQAKVALADVLLRLDRRAQAAAELKKALEFAPRHLATNERLFGIKLAEARGLAVTNPDASRETAREALAIVAILIESRPDLPLLLRNAGQAAGLAGLSAQAVDYYRQAFEATGTAEDLAAYATTLLNAGQGAIAHKVIEDNPSLISNSLYMRALRGRSLAASGQAGVAENLFNNLLKQNKEPADVSMITQQVAQSFINEPARAIKIFEGALGDDLPIDVELTITSLLMSQQMYDKVTGRLTKYVNNPVNDISAQFFVLTRLALAQQQSGQLNKSKATYELVFEKLKKNKDAIPTGQQLELLNNMAYLLADQLEGYAKESVNYAEQAVELISDDTPPLQAALIEDTLGWAYYKAGRNDDALRVLKRSVNRSPLAANQLHLGQAYLKAYEASGNENDKVQAALVLDKAVKAAKAENDEKLLAEAQKLYREAL